MASVNNGTVTANAAGSAIITVTTDDGGKQAACTVTVSNRINAQNPVITSQPTGGAVTVGHPHGLSVTASRGDNGTLSYEWYSNIGASNSGGTVITRATSHTYNPPTGTVGIYYYFVEVTNTIANNGDGGIKTASVRSNAVTVTVQKEVSFFFSFDQIIDGDPYIDSGIIISRTGSNGIPKIATLAVENPQDYDTGGIIWYITGTSITVNGPSIQLDSGNIYFDTFGDFFLTVEVKKGGKLYNTTITFKVKP